MYPLKVQPLPGTQPDPAPREGAAVGSSCVGAVLVGVQSRWGVQNGQGVRSRQVGSQGAWQVLV